MHTTLKFLALLGAPYIHDISRLRVKGQQVEMLVTNVIQSSCSFGQYIPKHHDIHLHLHGVKIQKIDNKLEQQPTATTKT